MGSIKYDAPTSFEGITEIAYNIIDEIGNTVFSGTVKVSKLEKAIVGNSTEIPNGEPNKKTWKDYIWIPIMVCVLGIITIIWKKLSKQKTSVL